MNIREDWQIILLAVLIILSGIALFAPTGSGSAGTPDNATDDGAQATDGGITNLQFGLELSGGTRLRAGLVGMTAEDVPLQADQVTQLERSIADELGIDTIDVTVRLTSQSTGTVEVFSENVTESTVLETLQAVGIDTGGVSVSDGVTADTRELAVATLEQRINQGGLTGGTVTSVGSATGENFVVVEVPNANRTEVLDLIGQPGRVQVVATFPTQGDNGTEYRNEPLLTQGDFQRIGQAEVDRRGVPGVGVTLKPEPAQRFQDAMNEFEFTTDGIDACSYTQDPSEPGYCLKTVVDEEVVYAASMSPDLASTLRGEAFVDDPTFRMQTTNLSDAEELKFNLEAGALPTELDIESQVYLAPSLAQKFKPLALLTGLIAWITVSGVIYIRYREPKVALPMLATAGAEVWILLGFASAIGLALDLSHIAGLIAVIGTGVDDLVIIADEILQRGEIATDRVFRNRFRKAFWVIGAAAITTIIAMSPLAILSLGDLQGFAIVTIVGVLIGVLITRPAYGDILRRLLLDTD